MYPSRWTQFFGPSTWRALHAITFTFPENPTEKQKKEYKDFVESLSKVLPCPHCSLHMMDYIKKHPVDVSSQSAFSRWGVDFHNAVNKRLDKPIMPYDQVKKRYAGWSETESKQLMLKSEQQVGEILGSPFYSEHNLAESPTVSPPVIIGSVVGVVSIIVVLIYWFVIRKRK